MTTFESATAQGTGTVRTPDRPSTTFASLAVRAARLRDEVQLTQADVADIHRQTQLGALDEQTAIVALQDPNALLDVLANEYGLSWTTIARLVGVTDAAVRKWRRGETIAAENRRRLARGVAFLQILTSAYPVTDVASWVEMRVSDESTITAAEIYSEGRPDLLFELVGQRMTPRQVLDAFDPNWSSSYAADRRFTVEDGPDGQPVIVQRREGSPAPIE